MKKIQYSTAMMANRMKPEVAPKAYANLQLTGSINITELAEHIAEHNSVFSKGTIVGILTELSVCMRELILQGYKVDLGDIGTFAPSISSEGAESLEKFNATNIKEMGVNFNPGKAFDNMRGDAEFEKTITRKAQAATLAAQIAGQTSADWTDSEGSGSGSTDSGNSGSTGSGSSGTGTGGNPSTGGSGQDDGGNSGGGNNTGGGGFDSGD